MVTAIDRAAREVLAAGGRRYRYDALVLATGSLVRELPQLPLGMTRVHYLRTEADARALAAALRECRHLVVVGGGLIGLEAAASAAELGIRTTVLEVAPRILARVCDEETGAFIAGEHRAPWRRYPHRHDDRKSARGRRRYRFHDRSRRSVCRRQRRGRHRRETERCARRRGRS